MARAAKERSKSKDSTANIGFETKLWSAAGKLRNNMHAAAATVPATGKRRHA